MTAFARTSATSAVHLVEGTRIAPVFDQETAAILNEGSAPYAALMPTSVLAGLTTAPVRFAPGRFITIQGSTRVYLPTADGHLLYLPEWALAADIGLAAAVYRTVPEVAVAGFDVSVSLSRFVSCGGQVLFASAGQLRPVAGGSESGFSVAPLDSATCELMNVANEAAAPVFVAAAGSPHIFHAVGGVYRHVHTPAKLSALAGSSTVRVIGVASNRFSALPIGQPYGAPGDLVKSPDSAMVFMVDGDRLVYLPSWTLAAQLGLSKSVRVTPTFPAPTNAPVLIDRILCGGSLYVARDGMLWPDPMASLEGALALAGSTCATLRVSV